MRIHLHHYKPIASRPRGHSIQDEHEIENYVDRLIEQDIAEECASDYAANCMLVPKKNGKKRLVQDYRPLNKAAIRDQYPMPNPNNLFNHMTGQKYFTTLDALEGFHQILIHPEDRKYTAFTTASRLIQYKRVPFGYTNSPAQFQRVMNSIFGEGIGTRCVAYVDDLLIFGRSPREHHDNLKWTLQKCREANLKINKKKCQIFQDQVTSLGRRISRHGITPLLDDLDLLKRDTIPKDKTQLRSLIGHLVFVSQFIPQYSELTYSLNNLTSRQRIRMGRYAHTDHQTHTPTPRIGRTAPIAI